MSDPMKPARSIPRGLVALGAVGLVMALVVGGALLFAPQRSRAATDRVIAADPFSSPPVTEPDLPHPEDPPADPYADVPIIQIGEIEIPKIALVHPIFEGVWLTNIDYGPGHWPGSAGIGEYGNAVFAGHRVTHSHPFRNIDQLAVGDTVILRTMEGASYTYEVTGTEVVTPDRLDVAAQTRGHHLTFFACHPPGSAAYRFVVHADLVSKPAPER